MEQTNFWNFLKTLFFGKYIGSDEFAISIMRAREKKDGLFMQIILKLQKLIQKAHGCIILSIRYLIKLTQNIHGKKHQENQTGTNNSYKPVKIRKNEIKKKYETWK